MTVRSPAAANGVATVGIWRLLYRCQRTDQFNDPKLPTRSPASFPVSSNLKSSLTGYGEHGRDAFPIPPKLSDGRRSDARPPRARGLFPELANQ